MRILQLAPIWETVPPPAYGGTETVVSCLTEELVRRGVEVVLCASGDSRTSAELRSYFPCSLRPAGLTDEALQYSLMHVTFALRDAADFDIVHNHSGPPSELGMALSHLTPVPMLSTLHNNLPKETEFIWSHYGGWYNTISGAQYHALPCLPRARYAGVVHNGIDLDAYEFAERKSDYALFMGRFAPEKAPHLAIEAARRAGVRILLAGKIGAPEERDYFEAEVRPRLDGSSAEFLGEAGGELKRALFRDARCLLAPIQWEEPFGLVMVEAMASGTPAIAFPRRAAPELIDHGRTGYLVDDVASMAEAIEGCGAIDAHACRRHVEQSFGPAALADNYLRVYEEIIAAEGEGRVALE